MGGAQEFGKVILSLAAVLLLMWFIARRVKTTGTRNGKVLDVLSRQQLTKGASVAVVRVQDKALIVGITDAAVSVLGETDLDAFQATLETAAARPVKAARPAKAPRPVKAPRTPKRARTAATALGTRTVPVAVPAGMTLPPGMTLPTGFTAAVPAAALPVSPAASAAIPASAPSENGARPKALAGSALSLDTWRQTVDSLRELTVRK